MKDGARAGGLDDDLACDINRFEQMTEEEVDHELARMGVDPAPTVAYVLSLVKAKMAAWSRPGPHGIKK
jgi:hypothetical protein